MFRDHCPLHAHRCFIGALVPEALLDHYGLGLTKTTAFLTLRTTAGQGVPTSLTTYLAGSITL